MKKILTIFAAAVLMLSMAACGNDTGSTVTQGGPTVDAQGNEVKGTAIDGAGKEADMDKVDGVELNAEKNAEGESKGEIAGLDVAIKDAKVVSTEESKILVLSFEFKNTSSQPVAFDNLISVETTQNQSKIMPTVITNMEGVNVLSGVEVIDSGKTTTVQKTYNLTDEQTPVKVNVYKYAEPAAGMLTKTFNLK